MLFRSHTPITPAYNQVLEAIFFITRRVRSLTSNAHRPSALPQTEIHPNLRSPNLESLTTRSLSSSCPSSAFLLSAQQMTFPLGPTPAFHTARLAYRAVDPTADLPFLKALDADPTT